MCCAIILELFIIALWVCKKASTGESRKELKMRDHVCPIWMGYLLTNPLRRLVQSPEKILSKYIGEGMSVIEVGPAMGFFSLYLARAVGEQGRVFCIDIQEEMLKKLSKRAEKSGLSNRIETRLCPSGSLKVEDLEGKCDFALVFAVVHETSDPEKLFSELYSSLKSGGGMLVSEPSGHVTAYEFEKTIELAKKAGFIFKESPRISLSRSAFLVK
ncbi:MAG: class I SAM-dependent methyltransferase [Myxococcota bacterium]